MALGASSFDPAGVQSKRSNEGSGGDLVERSTRSVSGAEYLQGAHVEAMTMRRPPLLHRRLRQLHGLAMWYLSDLG